MNFIKGIFSFLILLVLTIIGIVFIIAGLGESNYVLMGVGVLFLFPFLRKVYRRKFSTTNKKT
jgi:ABC-type bacteriocin/lantibiotic exporter with double-glycine peptidase domain